MRWKIDFHTVTQLDFKREREKETFVVGNIAFMVTDFTLRHELLVDMKQMRANVQLCQKDSGNRKERNLFKCKLVSMLM